MNKNNITYEEPRCKVVEVRVKQVIAASSNTTQSIQDYWSGYDTEEDF